MSVGRLVLMWLAWMLALVDGKFKRLHGHYVAASTDVTFSGNVTFTSASVRSDFHCARRCFDYCDCVMFTYRSAGGLCVGHSVKTKSYQSPVPTPGAVGYDLAWPRDCLGVLRNCGVQNGIYTVQRTDHSLVSVYCDQTTEDGGWMVIQRRVDGTLSFDRDWADYENGFGNLTSEFWLGLETLHQVTQTQDYEIRVELGRYSVNLYGHTVIDLFRLEGKDDYYRLRLGDMVRGNMSVNNYFALSDNTRFSTRDVRNDRHPTTACAIQQGGGFWYTACGYANFNGFYGSAQGMIWFHWQAFLTFSELKIRPVDTTDMPYFKK